MAASRTVFIDTAVSDYQTLAAQYDASVFNVVLLNAASSHADQIQSWLTAHNASATGINIVSASDSINGAFTPRVVFVDAGVADIGQVIAGVPANATVVVLDAGRDGVQQIHDYLAANAGKVGAIDIVTDLASVDVVSHGAPGEVTLGSTVLNADTLATYSKQLAEIGSHLSAGADLLLYGCDVASGTTGQQFISALAAATGADVAASTDLTGSAAAGGDWVLEANTGTIETAALDIAGYDGVLDSINVTSVSAVKFAPDSGTSSSDFITNVATQTITGTFAYTVSTNGQTPALKIWVSTTTGNNPTRYEGVLDTSTKIFTINNVPLATGADLPLRFWGSSSGNSQINIVDNGITKAFQPYTLDQIAPNAKVASLSLSSDTGSSQSDFITSVAAQTLSGKLNAVTVANEVVKISLDGGLSWQTASNTVGTIGFSLSGVTLPGSGTIQARVEDVAGNASDTFSQTFKVYTTAPTTSISTLRLSTDTGPSSTDFTTSVSAQTLSGTLSAPTSPDELVMISLDNGGTWQTASNTAGTNSFSLAGLNLSGSGTIKVRVDDKAGNSGAIYSQAFLVDATPPSAPGISTAAALTNNKAPVLTITAEADSTVQVYEGTTLLGTATQTSDQGHLHLRHHEDRPTATRLHRQTNRGWQYQRRLCAAKHPGRHDRAERTGHFDRRRADEQQGACPDHHRRGRFHSPGLRRHYPARHRHPDRDQGHLHLRHHESGRRQPRVHRQGDGRGRQRQRRIDRADHHRRYGRTGAHDHHGQGQWQRQQPPEQ
nr:DUF4347 domain-containing protein [Massilia sp. WF1]